MRRTTMLVGIGLAMLWGCASDDGGGGTTDGGGGADVVTGDGSGGGDAVVADISDTGGTVDTGTPPEDTGVTDTGAVDTGAPVDTTVAPDMVQEDVPPVDQSPFGGPCELTDTCRPTMVDDNGDEVDNPDWPTCLAEQCETGICDLPVCIKDCETDADCEGAVDGPAGASFKCVTITTGGLGGGTKRCLPGTTFAACKGDDECPAGEVCGIGRVEGTWGMYCTTGIKDGVGLGEACNLDPGEGDVVYCENGICFNFGCSVACDPADGAACGGDPSLTCQAKQYYSNVSTQFDMCFPRPCESDADCADLPDTFCRALLADGPDIKPGQKYWDHACFPREEGSVKPGETCSDDGEAAGLCENSFLCFDETCSTQCSVDADCPSADFACNVIEFGVDGYGYNFPLEVCMAVSGSATPCAAEKDCPAGETCDIRLVETAPFQYAPASICVTADATKGATGASCDDDNPCQTGLCVGDETSSQCSGLCTTSSDCPAGMGAGGETLNAVCESITWATVGTPSALDDIYAPICVYTAGSAADCSASLKCGGDEQCVPTVIATEPTVPAVVEWRCLGSTADQVDLGGDCESDGDCKSGACVLPKTGNDPGYCTSWCKDGDAATYCPDGGTGWTCADTTLLKRATAANSAVVGRCEKQ